MMLKPGQLLVSGDGLVVEVLELIGSGGQGEVYRVHVEGHPYALKWYHHPATDAQRVVADEQRQALTGYLLNNAPPDSRFLWPLAFVDEPEGRTYGYLMEMLPARFQGLESLVLGQMRPVPSFRHLCRAAIGLAECFRKLHNMGACYKDINLGGPVLDPETGDVMVCDLDNVRINKTPGNIIFIFFAAPELIRGEGTCQTNTDIHSLAVLLFYMFVRQHPLDGVKQLRVNVFNEAAQRKYYGRQPVFIFNPDDDTNRPIPGFHDHAIRNWSIYPHFLQRLFIRAFTEGLQKPELRVREGEWMEAFSRLRDTLFYCASCGSENFYDFERNVDGQQQPCWRCSGLSPVPIRLEIGDRWILLNHNTQLFAHHLGRRLDFDQQAAHISQHPTNAQKWGLTNVSAQKWTFRAKDGTVKECAPGRSVPLRNNLEINFGAVEGIIRVR
ncbi:MAG: DNA-binding helix-hairpin-helix protein with protein kinase domain [Myxococcota bacterium]|jgi:DNA-binding helix-hairpin-helix protein with protein kinase domain